MTFLSNSDLIFQFSQWQQRCILSASTIILSKDIDEYVFMCGSNFYETDVRKFLSGSILGLYDLTRLDRN